MKVLYYRLKKAEKYNKEMESMVDEFKSKLDRFRDLPGYTEIEIPETPEIDIAQIQRGIVKEYEDNPHFQRAVNGEETIEETYNRLNKVNQGIWRALPRRKNLEHNQEVEQLGELVGGLGHLKTKGIFAPDNIISAITYAIPLTILVCYILTKCFSIKEGMTPEEISLNNDGMISYGMFMGSIIGGLWGMSKRDGMDKTNESRCLDKKIQEFYH